MAAHHECNWLELMFHFTFHCFSELSWEVTGARSSAYHLQIPRYHKKDRQQVMPPRLFQQKSFCRYLFEHIGGVQATDA